ncbi:DUF4397 domain-containing protein [Halobellus rufus]|uniref:DUF4397 domain-containing protein n=1 Tax=Halobellus rufus TaxID=1448860 RepID=UPI001E35431E|nr:DUF4397 domain-containing protein [Halobellus rufus]
MVQMHLNRRQFVGTVTAVTGVGLAGCSDGGANGDGDGDGVATDGTGTDGSPAETDTETATETETDTEGEPTEEGDGDALVRVVHASPDAPNVDIYVDDESVLTDVAFRTVSEYLPLAAGSYQVRVTAAGDEETVVFDEEVSLSADSATTMAAIGELEAESFEVRAIEDDVSAPAEGESRVRAFHASPDAPAVDVAVEGEDEPLISELEFGAASEYATVPADAYTLEVRAAGETEAVATFDVDLAGATGYTAFAMGYLNPDEAPVDEPFDLTLATDTAEGEAATTTEGETTTADGTGTAEETETEAETTEA